MKAEVISGNAQVEVTLPADYKAGDIIRLSIDFHNGTLEIKDSNDTL